MTSREVRGPRPDGVEHAGVADDVEPADQVVVPAADVVEGAATAPPRGLRHSVRAFRSRDFAIFWWGALASNTGTWVQNLAVPFVLYQLTESALWVGLATFAQFVPAMVLGPLAGAMADRFDRRRVLLVTQGLQAVAAAGLWLAWLLGVRSPAAILALLALSGLFNGLNVPSWQSFVNDLVPRAYLLSAVTLNSAQFHVARAVGPAIAGILLATLGATWAFFINAVSFVFVLVSLLLVRARPQVVAPLSGGVMRQFGRALRYVRGMPGIVAGILVALLVGLIGNPIFQFTVVFAADVFVVGPLGLGLLNVALGVGAVLAAPLVSGWDSVVNRATIVRWGLVAYGVAMIVFATAPAYAVGVVALVVMGGGFLAVISTVNTAVQTIVADRVRGRVIGLRTVAFTGAYPLGALLQGWLADLVGPRVTVAGAGALMLGAALWLGWQAGLLAHLDDPHDESTVS